MLNLILNELKQIAKMTRIKDYNNMSKERSSSVLDELESVKSLNIVKVKNIKEVFDELGDRFLKPKIKEIRKNLSKSKIKEIEKNLLELEENLSEPKKYYDYDDAKYKGIRDVRNLFK